MAESIGKFATAVYRANNKIKAVQAKKMQK